jgi:hypothetical protein
MLTGMNAPLPPLSEQAQSFRPGIYRHYKGGVYRAMAVARHSEDPTQEFVVYRSTTEPDRTWIRPLPMFLEDVTVGEYRGPRFTWLPEA